jgi:DNA-binding response OmpR family regulator
MKIMLVDDDRDLADLLRYAFRRQGYEVALAFDGEHALRTFEAEAPDLVILDLNMPKLDGLNALKEIRRKSRIPILILTACGDEDKVIVALDSGADDFMVKPFRPGELRARVRALLRRAPREQGDVQPLTGKEFALIYYLMSNKGIALKASDIVDRVWGFESLDSEEVLKVTIYRLRKKLESEPGHPLHILTIPGYGYMFEAAPAQT